MEVTVDVRTNTKTYREVTPVQPSVRENNLQRISEIDMRLNMLDNSLNRGTEDLIDLLVTNKILTEEQVRTSQQITYNRLQEKKALRQERASLIATTV